MRATKTAMIFGTMDGASKFVRGDAIAGLIILAVNVFGGILIGITRHNMTATDAVNIFTKLSVGDGLVSQIPALIVSLAAGLLVSKGGTRGSADQAVVGQLTRHPRALFLAGGLMIILALIPGLPFLPFALLGALLAFSGVAIPKQLARLSASELLRETEAERTAADAASDSVREYLRATEVELCIGQQLASRVVPTFEEMSHRVAKMRRKFARRYGFVIPDIKLSNSIDLPPRVYQIRIHDAVVASVEIPVGDSLVIFGDGPKPDLIGELTREPAFGMNAMWISPAFIAEAKRAGYDPVDTISVILTHLSEVLRSNLAQLFSYRDMRALLDSLDPEYRKLLEEVCPAQISYSGLQSVFKALLAERISIRSLNLILEAIAEVVPYLRRVEQIVEHVRIRIAPQICNEVVVDGVLNVVRAGARWDQTFHRHLKRDAKGEIVEFDIDPPLIEQFQSEARAALAPFLDRGDAFALVTTPENRPYLRMITERLFPNISVLSTLEIARGVNIKTLGSIS